MNAILPNEDEHHFLTVQAGLQWGENALQDLKFNFIIAVKPRQKHL